MGCSTIIVERSGAKTGPALRPQTSTGCDEGHHRPHARCGLQGHGEATFAAVTISPNGRHQRHETTPLCVTINEIGIKRTADKAESTGRARPCCCRSAAVLEECGTWRSREVPPRPAAHTKTCCMTICDKDGGAVFELTPKSLEVRTHENGVCCCTNHFRTDSCADQKCERTTR